MTLPSYDPGVAANIISAVALALSGFTLFRMWQKDKSESIANYPDVLSKVWPEPNQEGWVHVQMKITNNFSTDVELTEVEISKPASAVGLMPASVRDPKQPDYDPKDLAVYPVAKGTRKLSFHRMLSSVGTPRPRLPVHLGSVEWFDFYISPGKQAATDLQFSVVFSLRRSDIRRAKRIVIKQQVMLPTKQTV